MSQDVLELFKAVVVNEKAKTGPNTMFSDLGVVVDFKPTTVQKKLIRERSSTLNMRTMFSVEERENSDPLELISKQILHYIEVYGLQQPGLFDLEFDGGTIVSMTYIKGVTVTELRDMVRDLFAKNAPLKDTEAVKRVIKDFNVSFNVNEITNNELRVALFDAKKHQFTNGDDAVRWLCYNATGSALLIKSKEVIHEVEKASMNVPVKFFIDHCEVLAEVFNRHKKLILASKNEKNRSFINRIARMSKYRHVPIQEPVSKRYISRALAGDIDAKFLKKIGIRDKFKFLNLLDYKRQQRTTDAFIIRNGKIHVEEGRAVWSEEEISRVENDILSVLKEDLAHLNDKKILLDPRVHYGLPISRKQSIGHLPFGTRVLGGKTKISAGIYWENDWGAKDLDLSTIDSYGNRTGWGTYSGYNHENLITFSGDITDARDGAMEFMTSRDVDYGLFVNIYSGEVGCGAEVVIGDRSSGHWINDVVIREKTNLMSRGSVIGFVKDKDFIVFQGRMGDGYISGDSEASVVARGSSDFWTVNRLFNAIETNFEVDKDSKEVYDIDMRYENFTIDKLEKILV